MEKLVSLLLFQIIALILYSREFKTKKMHSQAITDQECTFLLSLS